MAATIICQLNEKRSFINASNDKLVRFRFDLAARGQEEEIAKMEDLCQPETLVYLVCMSEDEYNKTMRSKEK